MNKFYILGTVFLLFVLAGCSSNPKPAFPENTQSDKYASSNPRSLYFYSMAETALMTGDTPMGLVMLEKADDEAPDNIFIKEEIINLLTILAFNDKEFNKEIVSRAEKYIIADTYNTRILAKAANAYAELSNYGRAEALYEKAIKEKPAMWLYLSFYHYKMQSYGKQEEELLHEALKQPWEKEEVVLMVIDTLLRTNTEAALEATRKGYEKWDDLNFFRELVSGFAAKNENREVLDLIEDRLDRGRDVPENYVSYLLGYYFTNLQFENILNYKDFVLASNSAEMWRILFFASAAKGEFKTAVYTGHLLEDTNQVPDDLLVPFYNEFSHIYFTQRNYAKCVEYLNKVKGWEVISEFFSFTPDPKDNDAYYELYTEFSKELLKEGADVARIEFILGTILTYLGDQKGLEFYDRISSTYLVQEDLAFNVIVNHLKFDSELDKVYSLLDSVNVYVEHKDRINSADEFIGIYYYETGNDTLAYKYFRKSVLEQQEVGKQTYLLLSFLAEKLTKEVEVSQLLFMGTQHWEDAEMMNIFGYFVADNSISEWYPQAKKALLEAIKLDPENAMIWDSLAWLYYRDNKHEEALSAMKLPETLVDSESEIAYHLGMILLKLDRKSEAKRNFEKAVEIGNNPEAVENSKRILKDQF